MAENVNAYFTRQSENSKIIVNYLYSNSSQLWDVISFLNNDYVTYAQNRLAKYYKSELLTYDSIDTFVNNCFQSSSNIENVIFYSNKMDKLAVYESKGTIKYINNVKNLTSGITNLIRKPNNIDRCLSVLSSKDQDLYNSGADTHKYYYIVSDIKDPYKLHSCGYLFIKYRLDEIDNNLSKFDYNKNEVLAIDANGTTIYDSLNKYYDKQYPYRAKLLENNGTVMLENMSYVSVHNNYPNIVVAGILPQKNIFKGYNYLIYASYILALLMTIISELFAYYKIRGYSRRTMNILGAMAELQRGNFKTRIQIGNENDDIVLISQSFNDMCIKLDEYIGKVYLAEISKKNAQINAFQSQINPHFLYNTLESIRMKAITNGDKEVGRMLYIMAILFRNMVKGGSKTTISQEIEYCRMYLELFQYRFNNAFTYEINVEPALTNKETIKFSIQPIVENYVLHGIRNGEDDNRIMINVEQVGNIIQISIEDNGTGIEDDNLKEIRDSLTNDRNTNSIGIVNVHNRIRLTYGEAYGVDINKSAFGGTIVIMTIPVEEEEGNV